MEESISLLELVVRNVNFIHVLIPIKLNPHNQPLMILQQYKHIWQPVNLGHSWAQNPLRRIIVEFFNIFKRTKHMLGIVIVLILNLIAVVATALRLVLLYIHPCRKTFCRAMA